MVDRKLIPRLLLSSQVARLKVSAQAEHVFKTRQTEETLVQMAG